MLIRLFRVVIRAYVRLHYPSWLHEMRAVRSHGRSFTYNKAVTVMERRLARAFGRTELIDVSRVKPGEVFVIELLPISHKEQIKQFKQTDRKAKRAAKQERRAARRG